MMNIIDFNRRIMIQYLHIMFPLEFVSDMGFVVGDAIPVNVDMYSQPSIFVFHHVKNNEAVFHPIQSLN